MKRFASIIAVAMCVAIVVSMAIVPASAAATTVAHWKFQNEAGYFKGDIAGDDFYFYDLTGNGNDLIVQFEGNGDQLDVFKWVNGTSDFAAKSASALYFGNTLTAAQSVDPYAPEETAYNGAYTSGRYFETVASAPINGMDFYDNGFTIEAIFMMDETFNMNYNRYTGIFSRQGLGEGQNEPFFSLAVAECSQDEAGWFTERMGLQYVHLTSENYKNNYELAYDSGLNPGTWIHFAVVNDSVTTELYVNGNLEVTVAEVDTAGIGKDVFGWEVGVGRKDFTDRTDTKGTNYPEGGIRRLFCGALAEIRVTEGPLLIEETLFGANPTYEITWSTEEAVEEAVVEEEPALVEVVEEEEEVEVAPAPTTTTTNPTTSDVSVIFYALAAISTVGGLVISKKK